MIWKLTMLNIGNQQELLMPWLWMLDNSYGKWWNGHWSLPGFSEIHRAIFQLRTVSHHSCDPTGRSFSHPAAAKFQGDCCRDWWWAMKRRLVDANQRFIEKWWGICRTSSFEATLLRIDSMWTSIIEITEKIMFLRGFVIKGRDNHHQHRA